MKNVYISVLFVLISLTAGCNSLEKSYARAERLTFQAIAPEYKHYVEQDAWLTPQQKELRLDHLREWQTRIEVGSR